MQSCRNDKINPNIVLIMADDLGYGDIGCYGNPIIQTPNLDQLASEGIKFMDFHSNGSVCSPTRASLLTGKYPQRTGIEGVITAKDHREVGLPLAEITIAEVLEKYGYYCGIFGKWHLGYSPEFNPVMQGFQEFVGFVSGNIDYHAHIDQEGYLDWWHGNEIANEPGYSTDLITSYGVEFIQRHHSRQTNQPFFLYLPYEAPHYPYQRRKGTGFREVGERNVHHAQEDSIPAIYREMIEVMDEGIGKIIMALQSTAQYQNTIVIFLSDNGASRNGDNGGLRGYKGGPYEGGSRVPAIFNYPARITRSSVNHETILTMDILPTLLDFIGVSPENYALDGISVKDHLLSRAPLPERDVFFSFKDRHFIRRGAWKLIQIPGHDLDKLELYNLLDDKREQHDVSSSNPELIRELSHKLEIWNREVRLGVAEVAR